MNPKLSNITVLVWLFVAAVFLNVPIEIYQNGWDGARFTGIFLGLIFLCFFVLEVFRSLDFFPAFYKTRSFTGKLRFIYAYMAVYWIGALCNALLKDMYWSPTLQRLTAAYLITLGVGMFPGMIGDSEFGPKRELSKKEKWTVLLGIVVITVLIGIGAAIIDFLLGQRSAAQLPECIGAAILALSGLVSGLLLGMYINRWVDALRPTFQLIRRASRVLIAFAAGYFTIIMFFATCFGASWKIEGSGAYAGLQDSPRFLTFVYFSLVTASTVGFGDIVPKSPLAKSLCGLEVISALAWTVVVFAALTVRLADLARPSEKKTKTEGSDDCGKSLERPPE